MPLNQWMQKTADTSLPLGYVDPHLICDRSHSPP